MQVRLVEGAALQLIAQVTKALNDGSGSFVLEIFDKGSTVEIGPIGTSFKCEGVKV